MKVILFTNEPTFCKSHFWTFPPVQFSTLVKTLVFESFNTWPKIAKHASFWTFRPPNVLWVDTNLRKLQICVPTKNKRTSKIQSLSKIKFTNWQNLYLYSLDWFVGGHSPPQKPVVPSSHALRFATRIRILEAAKGVRRPLFKSTYHRNQKLTTSHCNCKSLPLCFLTTFEELF